MLVALFVAGGTDGCASRRGHEEVIAVVFELVIDATFRPRRPLPLSPPLPSHCYLTLDSRLTDGAGPNFSDLLVALLVAEGTRDG